jgi:hypothetical protein
MYRRNCVCFVPRSLNDGLNAKIVLNLFNHCADKFCFLCESQRLCVPAVKGIQQSQKFRESSIDLPRNFHSPQVLRAEVYYLREAASVVPAFAFLKDSSDNFNCCDKKGGILCATLCLNASVVKKVRRDIHLLLSLCYPILGDK